MPAIEPHFLDASYVIALESNDDQNHLAALEHWQEVLKEVPSLITSSYVFDEIVTYFNSRNRHGKAIEVGEDLLASSAVELIQVDDALFLEGWAYFQGHTDKKYSLTDCISFVLMKRRKITYALTFDRHFAQAGFTKLPH